MFFWHVPAPDEALLISGSKHKDGATQFRIVTGHGSFVLPIKQKARVLSLALREAELLEECVTTQGIPLKVTAVAAEAEAARRRSLAEAEADAERVAAQAAAAAVKARAEGDAFAERATATAAADAINARAAALSGENQELIAANKLVEMLPSLVAAAAGGISGSNLTVLNGSQGVNEMAVGVVAQGLNIYDTLRKGLAGRNGSLPTATQSDDDTASARDHSR